MENDYAKDIKFIAKDNHTFTNWAKTYSCKPKYFFVPNSVKELREILYNARNNKKTIRVVGCGHSPSELCLTNDYLISMENMNKVLKFEKETLKITCEAGITLDAMNSFLEENNAALSIIGSISDITLAGAISTGTHGTGRKYGSLSTYVTNIELMNADGKIICIDKEHKDFNAVVLSFGCLGIILTVTIQCEKKFYLHQNRYSTSLEDILKTLDVHVNSSDHFKFLWTFFPKLVIFINKIYQKFLFSKNTTNCNVSYKIFNFNCLFSQYVMEWAVPFEKTAVVLYELKSWIENNKYYAHFPIEVRFVKEDNILLSPSYKQFSTYINIIMYRPYGNYIPHENYWQGFEKIMLEYHGRPHWAKDFQISKAIMDTIYPKWNLFKKIREKYDPHGVFLNDRLQEIFYNKN